MSADRRGQEAEQPAGAVQSSQRGRKGLKHSRKAEHPAGMAEQELRELQREEVAVPNRLKKRALREITIHEQAKIIHAVTRDFARQADVAAQYRTSPALVCRLVRQHRQDPFILSKRLSKKHKQDVTAEAVQLEVAEML